MSEEKKNLNYARKYRANDFAHVIGNQKAKESLMQALKQPMEKWPQVIMLWGDGGCGKTTLGRILGKEYSCLNRNNETGACNTCENCLAINDYIKTGNTDNLINIREINVAEDSGKNDLSDVFEEMLIPSLYNEWKIYIFDEVQKASNGLQNRLLKITEETPEHVLIVFCTTEPDKILPTLKTRCQLNLHIQKPKLKELMQLLKYVCKSEGVEFDLRGLEYIASNADLVVRQSLLNLEQVVHEHGNATYDSATETFDNISQTLITSLFKYLKAKDVYAYITTLHKIKTHMELSAFLEVLKNFVVRGLYTINGVLLDGVTETDMKVYKALFADIGVEEVAYLLRRILAIEPRNAEIELMTLGYTGLDLPTNINSNTEESTVLSVENEVAKEEQNAVTILKQEEKKEFDQGVENATKYFQTVTVDDLVALGGVVIE